MATTQNNVRIVVFETASGHQVHQSVSSAEDIYAVVPLAPRGTVMLYFYTPLASLRQPTCHESRRSKMYFVNPKISGSQLRIDQDWRPPRFVTYDETIHQIIETVDCLV